MDVIFIVNLRFDADHDGVVSTSEVGKIMRNLGHNPSDAELQVRYLSIYNFF